MTQRRRTRAAASSTAKVTVTKRQPSKEGAAVSRTLGSSQAGKNPPSSTQTGESTKYVLRKKSATSALVSDTRSKPTALKKNVAKGIEKVSVMSPVASKVSEPGESPGFLKITNVVSLRTTPSSKETAISKRTPTKQSPAKRTPSTRTPSQRGPPKRSPVKQSALKQSPKSPRTPSRRSPLKQAALKQSSKSPQTPSRRSPLKQAALKQSPKSPRTPSRRSPLKQAALKQSPKSPQTPSRRSPLKLSPVKLSSKSPQTPSRRSPVKQSALKQSPKSPHSPRQTPLKQTSVQSTPSKRTPRKEIPSGSPNIETRSSRKRLIPSQSPSPQVPKVRKLTGKEESAIKTKSEQEDECVILDEVSKECPVDQGKKKTGQQKKSGTELPSDPELSNSFLRRKWFSLKARGGFTCLRSAVLSPQEIVNEVIEHASVKEAPKDAETDFFTTKLMVRLASRLPPVRARPSCEELVDLINSKVHGSKAESLSDPKKEGTAIRVKLESRSFSDTLTHIKNKPVTSSDITGQANTQPAKQKGDSKPEPTKRRVSSRSVPVKWKRLTKSDTAKQKKLSKREAAKQKGRGGLSKKQERAIALRQLKDLSVPELNNSDSKKSPASTSTNSNESNNGKRLFTLKLRGSGSSSSLRSAILSPEELTAEFLKRTKVDPQTCLTAQSLLKQESRGSYKGVSTDELVSLIQSKQMEKHLESIKPKPLPKAEESPTVEPEKSREKQLALQQLNVLRYW